MARGLAQRAANAPCRESSPETPDAEWRWRADGWGNWNAAPPMIDSLAAPEPSDKPKSK